MRKLSLLLGNDDTLASTPQGTDVPYTINNAKELSS